MVILRGDGAVNDLAWWHDCDLARCVSELEVSLLTGVGHARDNTVLDEVENNRCDMPSKVNPKVVQVIAKTVGSRPRGPDRGRSCAMSQDAELRSYGKVDQFRKMGIFDFGLTTGETT